MEFIVKFSKAWDTLLKKMFIWQNEINKFILQKLFSQQFDSEFWSYLFFTTESFFEHNFYNNFYNNLLRKNQ